jgi:hypothetical protein
LNLRDLLVAAAADLPDVEVATGPGGELSWSRGGRTFAVLTDGGAAAEFELDRAVAAAAARTRDARPSERGPGWVHFRPVTLDEHGADRAAAWFTSAHRRQARG